MLAINVFVFAFASSVAAFDASSPFLIANVKGLSASYLKYYLAAKRRLPEMLTELYISENLVFLRSINSAHLSAVHINDALNLIPCARITLVFDQPNIHASDLARFSDTFSALKDLMRSEASITIPYTLGSSSPIDAIKEKLTASCGFDSDLSFIGSNDNLSAKSSSVSPQIFVSKLQPFYGPIQAQQLAAKSNQAEITRLIDQIKQISSAEDDFVIVFASSSSESKKSSSLAKRSAATAQNSTFVPFNSRTYIQKYVLFNMGVFEGFVPLFIVIAVSLLGVNLLRSVQSPTKFEEPTRK
ncbi:hypothetical protein HK100_010082 [Physocladia obscura]|uniref:Protein BIG1 n=1 Tax=Physocladia obscura TaxID=109957 RepID=A0AAD5XHB9_9FUNG|nr:hypothetical protein HK100_010082 [Physocladia obscura]